MKLWAPAVVLLSAVADGAEDWRTELLKEENIGTRRAELRAAATDANADRDEWQAALAQLGADDYPTREQSQRKLEAAGPEILKWLQTQRLPDDPEVLLRIRAIRDTLEFAPSGTRSRMVGIAVESLLESGRSRAFYEWFGEDAEILGSEYRGFTFKAPENFGGEVSDGRLVLDGGRPGEGDQRLILPSDVWPGTTSFTGPLRVSAKLGGTAGDAGSWHLGIAVGKVRALYHPGLEGGSFRFEQVGTRHALSDNEAMGFTPSTESMQRMVIDVRDSGQHAIALHVRIDQQGSGRFEKSITVDRETIGELSQVSVDRSGRAGGDAIFDDLVIERLEP